MMLTKTNICLERNYLRGNTDPQLFENDKQNVGVASLEKFLRTPMNNRAFSLFVTFVLSLITNCLFLSGVQRGGGERGAGPGHPRQGGIQRVELQKFKCCN